MEVLLCITSKTNIRHERMDKEAVLNTGWPDLARDPAEIGEAVGFAITPIPTAMINSPELLYIYPARSILHK